MKITGKRVGNAVVLTLQDLSGVITGAPKWETPCQYFRLTPATMGTECIVESLIPANGPVNAALGQFSATYVVDTHYKTINPATGEIVSIPE